MAESQISVGASLAYGWRLWAANARSIWGILALSSLAFTVQMAGAYAQNQELLFGGGIAQLITQPMMYGSVFRIAFADRHPGDAAFAGGHAGLQWRGMEWRLLGASLLTMLVVILIALLAFVLVTAIALGLIVSHGGAAPPTTPEAVMTALGPQGQTIMLVILAIAASGLIFFVIRLSLVSAATADRGKITVLESWPFTKGQVWRIFVALLVVQLPLTIIQSLVTSATTDGAHTGAAVIGMAPEPAMLSALVTGVVYGAAVAPITAGILAYFYRAFAATPAGGPPEARP